MKTKEQLIKYYQKNKNQFWIDCLQSDKEQRQYLYNDWIEDYFNTSEMIYKTCDRCSYDILDNDGEVMSHYCKEDKYINKLIN